MTQEWSHNNAINSDSKKRRAFVAPLFTAGYGERWAKRNSMTHFPKLLRSLPKFEGPFDAFKLEAKNCDVLFASYPAGTTIPPHSHETENVGIITQGELILTLDGNETHYGTGQWYHVPARAMHAAQFEKETSEIEFWFYGK